MLDTGVQPHAQQSASGANMPSAVDYTGCNNSININTADHHNDGKLHDAAMEA